MTIIQLCTWVEMAVVDVTVGCDVFFYLPQNAIIFVSVVSSAQLHRTPSQNTKLSTGSPKAPSLLFAEIRQQQTEEDVQLASGGLPSAHAGYERPLLEVNAPSPAGREHLFSPPKYNETRILEVGTSGPFEKSISHAHDEMNSITSKGKSVRNATFREVNKAAEEIITSLSEKGRFVGLEKVKAALCKEFGKTSLSAFGFRTERDIPALKELIEKQAKVSQILCKVVTFGRSHPFFSFFVQDMITRMFA